MSLYLGEDLISGTQIVTDKSERIGQIIASTIPLTDAGLHLLDGALIQGSGSYSAFVDYIADLYDSGDYTAVFETEADWQTSVTTYGVCGKFVYDSVNNTVRLPKITGIIEGTTDLTALGDLVEAGLPNITGALGWVWSYSGAASGAFHLESNENAPGGSGQQSGRNYSFDASLSNPIYGNSTTVQPQSVKVLYYIVIATSVKTDIEVDIDEIATDLNGKADVDLTNCTDVANIKMAHNAMPSDTYVDLTLGASGSTYTAPADGFVTISKSTNGTNQWLYIHSKLWTQGCANPSGYSLEIFCPVTKGEQFTISYSAGGTVNRFRFIYAVGSESEAS